ncbi:5'-3' exonuclease [Mycoplasma buteonis]|uniref:5'-3' exonuclease n=1 Tax=Mycoplasma buteonis TaxID=171280 RepID=UPI00055C1B1A|nr:5'-3' exonuclease H3TH domain-containing protein [Mycoplasma buteonis]
MKTTSLVIDGNYLMFQSFYATYYRNPNDILRSSKGVPTNGISVFLSQLTKLVEFINPTHLFIAFDAKEKTKRHEIFQDYKSGRTKAPSELFQQFDLIKEILSLMQINHQEISGFEADDLIAAYCEKIEGEKFVFSHDRDLMQLINPNTKIINKSKDFASGFKVIDEEIFLLDNGYTPKQVIDFKALKGDASDNLPGIKGIGDVTAVNLISNFGSFQAIFDNINSTLIKPAVRKKLVDGQQTGQMCYELTVLNPNVPNFQDDLNNYSLTKVNLEAAIPLLDELELKTAKAKLLKPIW